MSRSPRAPELLPPSRKVEGYRTIPKPPRVPLSSSESSKKSSRHRLPMCDKEQALPSLTKSYSPESTPNPHTLRPTLASSNKASFATTRPPRHRSPSSPPNTSNQARSVLSLSRQHANKSLHPIHLFVGRSSRPRISYLRKIFKALVGR